jgi:hypothetical protein
MPETMSPPSSKVRATIAFYSGSKIPVPLSFSSVSSTHPSSESSSVLVPLSSVSSPQFPNSRTPSMSGPMKKFNPSIDIWDSVSRSSLSIPDLEGLASRPLASSDEKSHLATLWPIMTLG